MKIDVLKGFLILASLFFGSVMSQSFNLVHTISPGGEIYSVRISPDGKYLAYS